MSGLIPRPHAAAPSLTRFRCSITERLDPDSDVYQEDIATYWYCRQVGACEEGMESLDEQLRRADL